ncbi:ABC transporter substrate-binding protein [Pseudonocardia spinosispora]|uniref:ABC transporter substrate-binding protein n=1 Tax=Pseudonocardia spinosispora TaxID=103441 RepID=UPI0004071087|nr:ABC transporter substrate-binding protein [Pseudonocardia spinosispora]
MSRLRWAAGAVVLLALSGCAASPDAGPGASATREIVTAHGTVRVPAQPKRIVVLSGGLAGNLYELGAPIAATDTRVLGVTTDGFGFPPAWSDQARAQGSVALPNGDDLNIEAVAAARPDLIIGGGQGLTGFQAESSYDNLAKIAPTVLVPRTVDTWQEELRQVADAVGRSDRVPGMLRAYEDKVAQVRAAIAVPPGSVVVLLSIAGGEPYLVPSEAALPELLRQLGFTPDDVATKAGNPRRVGTGDSFRVSRELLSQSADAPTAFFIQLTGPPFAQVAADPRFARLPAFRSGQVHELPQVSFRPDHAAVMRTLDLIEEQFRRPS